MNVKDIEIGNWYHISGDIDNGTKDEKPNTSHDEVTRRIKRVTDTHIICESDRKFLINDNLKLSIPAFRRTDMANSQELCTIPITTQPAPQNPGRASRPTSKRGVSR